MREFLSACILNISSHSGMRIGCKMLIELHRPSSFAFGLFHLPCPFAFKPIAVFVFCWFFLLPVMKCAVTGLVKYSAVLHLRFSCTTNIDAFFCFFGAINSITWIHYRSLVSFCHPFALLVIVIFIRQQLQLEWQTECQLPSVYRRYFSKYPDNSQMYNTNNWIRRDNRFLVCHRCAYDYIIR